MNYLAHYVFNHDVCGTPQWPYFATGVALPDLWARFSRRRRLRWKAVRAAAPQEEPAAALRAGLLNHVEVDNRFHVLPCFLTWLRQIKRAIAVDSVHSMVVDFVAHVAVELALDHHLMQAQPHLADRFYDTLAETDPVATSAHVGALGDVDTSGLEETIASFVERRYMRRYATEDGVRSALHLAVSISPARTPVPGPLVDEAMARALRLADAETVWRELDRG